MTRRWLYAGIAGFAVVVLVASALRGNGERTRYTTEPARRGELSVTVTATGTLEPTNQVDIGSELSGTIRSVLVDWNDAVTAGQVLARLDTTRLEAQVLQSRAALDAARARVVQAQASQVEAEAQLARLVRVREISGGKVPSRQELDAGEAAVSRARAEVASARAAVAQAQATLETQQTDLGKAELRSPIDGVVLVRAVEPGQTVAASLQAPVLFTLAEDLTRMELVVSVDEADVGQVAAGQDATFTVDAWPDRVFPAKVEQVRFGAQALEGVVTYATVLAVDNRDGLLRPGMTATAEILVRQVADALLVPNAALRFAPPERAAEPSGGLLRAFLPGPRFGRGQRDQRRAEAREQRVFALVGGALQPIPVTTGGTDGVLTEVTGGDLEPGTELVVEALARAR
jgi:HlyD family secretion protein